MGACLSTIYRKKGNISITTFSAYLKYAGNEIESIHKKFLSKN